MELGSFPARVIPRTSAAVTPCCADPKALASSGWAWRPPLSAGTLPCRVVHRRDSEDDVEWQAWSPPFSVALALPAAVPSLLAAVPASLAAVPASLAAVPSLPAAVPASLAAIPLPPLSSFPRHSPPADDPRAQRTSTRPLHFTTTTIAFSPVHPSNARNDAHPSIHHRAPAQQLHPPPLHATSHNHRTRTALRAIEGQGAEGRLGKLAGNDDGQGRRAFSLARIRHTQRAARPQRASPTTVHIPDHTHIPDRTTQP
ncbi:hypothetical protein PLICRDRAFT_173008 [Plicaturopsis crispa FD-325 SS-3]|nr:hypothetical protein PLICRDRAFT_173008 [Plicaturopsis crispa FD-325 SS-3]